MGAGRGKKGNESIKLPHITGNRRLAQWIVLALLLGLASLVSRWAPDERSQYSADRSAREDLSGRPRLVDGDSFHLGPDEVRLEGIDAPEGRQTCRRAGRTWACGEAARRELEALIGGRAIVCKRARRDQYGRVLAICSAGPVELNRAMVEKGFAVAFGPRYVPEERAAAAAKRGLWSGEFERPQAWRKRHGI